MKRTIVADYDEMSRTAADRVAATLRRTPNCALCLPTGNSPVGMFKVLIERIKSGEIDASQAQFFLLDEYIGLDDNDPDSLTGWLMNAFLRPAGIPAQHIHELPTKATDLAAAAKDYEAELQAFGGYELAVLGLGGNGHIAYNEPGSTADSRTRVLTLTEESIEQARGYFHGRTVPTKAMSGRSRHVARGPLDCAYRFRGEQGRRASGSARGRANSGQSRVVPPVGKRPGRSHR